MSVDKSHRSDAWSTHAPKQACISISARKARVVSLATANRVLLCFVSLTPRVFLPLPVCVVCAGVRFLRRMFPQIRFRQRLEVLYGSV